MKQFRSIIWGIAIIALGVILGGNALGWFSIDIFFDGWWTLFIIVPSAIKLVFLCNFKKNKYFVLYLDV